MKTKGRTAKVIAVSMPPALRKSLDARLSELGLGPSAYVQQLVRKDLGLPIIGPEKNIQTPETALPKGAQLGETSRGTKKKPAA